MLALLVSGAAYRRSGKERGVDLCNYKHVELDKKMNALTEDMNGMKTNYLDRFAEVKTQISLLHLDIVEKMSDKFSEMKDLILQVRK